MPSTERACTLTINRDRAIFHNEFVRLKTGFLGHNIGERCGGEVEYEPSVFRYFHEDGWGFRCRGMSCG